MVNAWTIIGGFVLFCALLGRYGKRPGKRVVKMMQNARGVHKLPWLVVVALLVLLWSQRAHAGLGDWVDVFAEEWGAGIIENGIAFLETITAAIINAFAALICLLIEQFGPWLTDIMDSVPESVVVAAGTVKTYLAIANSWLPVQEGMAMFAAFLVFLMLQLPTKLLIKLFVPTVG